LELVVSCCTICVATSNATADSGEVTVERSRCTSLRSLRRLAAITWARSFWYNPHVVRSSATSSGTTLSLAYASRSAVYLASSSLMACSYLVFSASPGETEWLSRSSRAVIMSTCTVCIRLNGSRPLV
jgi:hypothetical protein